jgi:hypothetical protein
MLAARGFNQIILTMDDARRKSYRQCMLSVDDSALGNMLMAELEHLDKRELHGLADTILLEDQAGVERCVTFFEAETRGYWHNRARAMMARRFKHGPLTEDQRGRLLRAVLGRLTSGRFTEQFKDQLRLALFLDRERTCTAARMCLASPKDYIRRYAAWVLARESG